MHRRRQLLGFALASASVFALTACGNIERSTRMPLSAMRESPPPTVADTAIKVGAAAPDFTLPSTTGEFSLSKRRADGPVVLVFYRGDW